MGKRRWIKKRERGQGNKKLTKIATDDAKPWVNGDGSRKGRGGEGNNKLTKMVADDAKPWVKPSHR